MSQYPVCELCKERHGPKQAHRFAPKARDSGISKAKSKPNGVNGVNASGVNRNADRHSPGYMKEYMRKYRAKAGG